MKVRLLSAVLLISASSYAMAADGVVDEVVVVDGAYDWSGVYVGVDAGYAFGSSDVALQCFAGAGRLYRWRSFRHQLSDG